MKSRAVLVTCLRRSREKRKATPGAIDFEAKYVKSSRDEASETYDEKRATKVSAE